jgi:hypothetical protein
MQYNVLLPGSILGGHLNALGTHAHAVKMHISSSQAEHALADTGVSKASNNGMQPTFMVMV